MSKTTGTSKKMAPIEITDYPSLSLGYESSSRTDVSIVGLDLQVWGLEEIRESKRPIAVLVSDLIPLSS
jgi:hypothetical protein